MAILEPNRTYLFSQFTEFAQPPGEILAELGYQLRVSALDLPSQQVTTELLPLQRTLEKRIQLTPLTSEQARREALVAPILFDVVEALNLQLNIEYPLTGKHGKGTLDYLIRAQTSLLVAEAKRDDLTRGFTQLAIEMIELGDSFGAVTTGNIWQFARLVGTEIVQDINLYRVPADLVDLISVLHGILAQ